MVLEQGKYFVCEIVKGKDGSIVVVVDELVDLLGEVEWEGRIEVVMLNTVHLVVYLIILWVFIW